MAGALPKLFRHSWGFAAAALGALASTMAIAAALFRHIGRDAVHGTGHCAPEALDGIDVYCRLGLGLARIAGFLNLGAIVVAAAAFFAAWHWWQARATVRRGAFRDVGTGHPDDGGSGGDGGD
jgi:hypothetical protein